MSAGPAADGGSDTGGSASSGGGHHQESPVAPVALTGTGGPAPLAPAGIPGAPVVTAPPPPPPVAQQLAPQLTALAAGPDGSHAVTIVLSPESLGEVHVRLIVRGDQMTLTLASGHEHGRAALTEALPDLRRDLAAAGLTVTGAGVSAELTGQSPDDGQPPPGWAQGWGQQRPPSDQRELGVQVGRSPADKEITTSPIRPTRTGESTAGVDVRV